MKRFSKGRWNIAGDGTKTLDCGGWSGLYNSLSPALYSTPEQPNRTINRAKNPL